MYSFSDYLNTSWGPLRPLDVEPWWRKITTYLDDRIKEDDVKYAFGRVQEFIDVQLLFSDDPSPRALFEAGNSIGQLLKKVDRQIRNLEDIGAIGSKAALLNFFATYYPETLECIRED